MKKSLLLSILIMSPSCFAQQNMNMPNMPGMNNMSNMNNMNNMNMGNMPPHNEEVDKALQDCAKSTGDSTGHPDRVKMDTCMQEKGFKKPDNKGPVNNSNMDNKKEY